MWSVPLIFTRKINVSISITITILCYYLFIHLTSIWQQMSNIINDFLRLWIFYMQRKESNILAVTPTPGKLVDRPFFLSIWRQTIMTTPFDAPFTLFVIVIAFESIISVTYEPMLSYDMSLTLYWSDFFFNNREYQNQTFWHLPPREFFSSQGQRSKDPLTWPWPCLVSKKEKQNHDNKQEKRKRPWPCL